MMGLIVLTFIPLVVAIGFMIRARAEQKARRAAEQQLADLRARHDQRDGGRNADSEWVAVLAHELRSPLAAILGYEELLEDGTFGELDAPALDALRRMRFAAAQLTSLIDGLEGDHPDGDHAPERLPARILIDQVVDAVRYEAEGRSTTIEHDSGDTILVTFPTPALRALVLMLGAAIKGSPNTSLRIVTHDGPVPRISISGTRLDPDRDSDAPDRPLTGSALRLQLARAVAAPAQASIDLDADGTLHLHLPRLGPA
jgi:signal transduction histidine kinase